MKYKQSELKGQGCRAMTCEPMVLFHLLDLFAYLFTRLFVVYLTTLLVTQTM
jgi:hypothetical protein